MLDAKSGLLGFFAIRCPRVTAAQASDVGVERVDRHATEPPDLHRLHLAGHDERVHQRPTDPGRLGRLSIVRTIRLGTVVGVTRDLPQVSPATGVMHHPAAGTRRINATAARPRVSAAGTGSSSNGSAFARFDVHQRRRRIVRRPLFTAVRRGVFVEGADSYGTSDKPSTHAVPAQKLTP
jgi:hypothetical protein